MAVITPSDLKAYTEFEAVQKRSDDQLKMDILEAESYINPKLEEPLDNHEPLPDNLKLATLKISQYFALINSDESLMKGYKSEKMSDYSYTLADGDSSMPDISGLIDEYLPKEESNGEDVFLRMRGI